MFSAGRLFASSSRVVASRASAISTTIKTTPCLLSSLRQPQTFRYFAAQTFLDAGEVTERIISVVKNFDQVDANKVTGSAVKFVDDLGLDSLDVVEVVMAIEDEFAIEIPDAEADKISTIQEAVDYISAHPMAK